MTVRVNRRAAVALVLLGTLATAGVASAAGVGGVEVTPRQGSSFHVTAPPNGTADEEFTVRNIGRTTATVRLYTASADSTDSGGWSVGGAGSAPWLELPAASVTLQPGQSRDLRFTVLGSDDSRNGAVVVEQGTGTVVQRAATLVYATPGRAVPLPWLILAVAVGLLGLAGVGVAIGARRRDRAARWPHRRA
ncbi:MAG: hypothetical protein H7233_12290 [Pseudorhodobacter sp.]|nr:hypothetical protein [Frankiaceae bacterium]